MKKLLFLTIPLGLSLSSYALLERIADTAEQAVEGAGEVVVGAGETAAGIVAAPVYAEDEYYEGPTVGRGVRRIGHGIGDIVTSPENLVEPRDGYYVGEEEVVDEENVQPGIVAAPVYAKRYYRDGYYGRGYRGRYYDRGFRDRTVRTSSFHRYR